MYGFFFQLETIPLMLKNYNVMCAAETGSGKTLAFLLPLLHKILRVKADPYYSGTPPNTPHGLILSPSRELADQIHVSCERNTAVVHYVIFSYGEVCFHFITSNFFLTQ